MAYPEVNFRYVMLQPAELYYTGFDELNMEGAHTWPLQVGGRQQAIDTLNAEISNDSGKIHNVKHILQEWINDIETLS